MGTRRIAWIAASLASLVALALWFGPDRLLPSVPEAPRDDIEAPSSAEADAAMRARADGTASEAAAATLDGGDQRVVVDAFKTVRVVLVTPMGRALARILRRWDDLGLRVVGQGGPFPARLAPLPDRVHVGTARWVKQKDDPPDGLVGVLHFREAPPVHVALLLHHIVLEQQVVGPDQEEVRFVVDPWVVGSRQGTLVVRVVDSDSGAALTRAIVMAPGPAAIVWSADGEPVDADGRAVVRIAPGVRTVTIGAADRESMERTVLVEPGQRIDLGEIRLGSMLPFRGRVVSLGGRELGSGVESRLPEAMLTVSCTPLKWHTVATEFPKTGQRCGSDGSFAMRAGRGRLLVTAGSANGLLAVGVFDNPPPGPVELHLVPAAELTVVRPADLSRRFVLTVFGAAREPIAATAIEAHETSATMRLPRGDHGFEVHDQHGRCVQRGTLHLGAESTTLEIR